MGSDYREGLLTVARGFVWLKMRGVFDGSAAGLSFAEIRALTGPKSRRCHWDRHCLAIGPKDNGDAYPSRGAAI